MEERKWWAEYCQIYKGSLAQTLSQYYIIKGMYDSCRKAKEAAKNQLNQKISMNPKIDHVRIRSIFDQEKAKEIHMKPSEIKY